MIEERNELRKQQEGLQKEFDRENQCQRRWEMVIQQLKALQYRLEEWERSLERLAKDFEKQGNDSWKEEDSDPELTDQVTNAVDKDFARAYTGETQRLFIDGQPPVETRNSVQRFFENRLRVRPAELTQGTERRPFLAEYELVTDQESDERELRKIGEEIANRRMAGEHFDVLKILYHQRDLGKDLLTQFFRRCKPFWDHDVDRHESFDEMSLEPIAIFGVPASEDDLISEIQQQHSEFEPVSTNDRRMLMGIHVAHGLNPRFIRRISEYYNSYAQAREDGGEPVGLDRRWGEAPYRPDDFIQEILSEHRDTKKSTSV